MTMNYLEIQSLHNQPRICHVIESINENTGGAAYSVTSLAQALSEQRICCHLFTLNYPNLGKQLSVKEVNLHSYQATNLARIFRGFKPSASHHLNQLASTELDLIHNHGLWLFFNIYARQAAIKNRLPLIISPKGMLELWALNYSWYKKKIAWFLYEQKNLRSATIFQATSLGEILSIRRMGFKQPIALIPEGINIPQLDEGPNKHLIEDLFPELKEKQWLLFLSRIHPKKGLDNLLYVWQLLAKKYSDWHLVIAGPDLIGYQDDLEQLTKELNIKKQVTFTGMLSGKLKASALSNAELFVLPTHSENFGIVIAESLAYGVPVITTKCTPWQDLLEYNCGWWIEDTQEALMDALVEGIELTERERQEMGLRGREMVEKKYSWYFIAQEMSTLYHWILGGGNAPHFIHF